MKRAVQTTRVLMQPVHNVRWMTSTIGKQPTDNSEKTGNFSTSAAQRTEAEPVVEWVGSTPVFPASHKELTLKDLSDVEVTRRVVAGKAKFFNLEKELGNKLRAVKVRRSAVENMSGRANSTADLPYENFDYDKIFGQCCENVIGHVPIPVGVAGPLLVDGHSYMVPMATTEGALIASTTRGCKALSMAGGASTALTRDGMTRAPVIQCRDVKQAQEVAQFAEEGSFDLLKATFDGTSRFARLQKVTAHLAGRKVYLRFTSSTGDAMGMNMVGKGTEAALGTLLRAFPNVRVLALSGNVCTDKKSSAMNWVNGRGKSVSVDCVIPGHIVRDVLKTSVAALTELNYSKNMLGSAVAGSIGGFNAHAANVVTAIFLATGQDPAQNVESSSCITMLEPTNDGEDLYAAVTMPSIEVGTCGGGTSLAPQSAMLGLLGCKGVSTPDEPDKSARLARIIASTVLAGELSLMSALTSGDLISSHLKLNRK